MTFKTIEREHILGVVLTLIIISTISIVFFAATLPSDAPLKRDLYLFWSFFFKIPALILFIVGLLMLILFILSFTCSRKIMDFILLVFSFSLTALFFFLLSLNVLNLGLDVLAYPFIIPRIPPLSVFNPAGGLLAFSLILLKGLLLERIFFNGSTWTERICLIMGFGFGITSLQVAVLSYAKVLYQPILASLDLAFIGSVILLWIVKNLKNSSEAPHCLLGLKLESLSIPHLSHVDPWKVAIILAVGLLLAADSYYAVAAVVEFDSLAYMVHYAKIIYENHGVLDLYGPSLGLEMSAAYPIGFQALGVYFYEYVGVADDFYMRILPPIFYLLLLLACYLFSSQFFEDEKDRLLCLFAVSSTLILNYYVALSSHYVAYITFLETLSLNFLVKFLRVKNEKLFFISAVFGGFASLVSYLGLCTILFLLIISYLGRVKPSTILRSLLICLSIPSIYLIRNLILSGDPIYPFLTFSSEKLWVLRRQHFYIQSIYAGLQISNPFSIIEFLVMRCLGSRPWLTVDLLAAPIFIVFFLKENGVKALLTEEKALLVFFAAAIFCFFLTSTFERYLLPLISIYACIYMWTRKRAKELKMHKLAFILALILVYSYSFTLGASLGGYKTFNFKGGSNDVLDYLKYYYKDDAECWRWINKYTSQNDRIASFEIRHYYIKRDIFLLDGKEAAPLYRPNITINEALQYLKSHGVKYILSPSWVSMSGILPAYKDLIITSYLGDPDYLPAVYVHGSSAIYHVGPLDLDDLVAEYLSKRMVPPILGIDVHLNVTLNDGIAIYSLDIPGDYHEKANMTVEVLNGSSMVSIEIVDGDLEDVKLIKSLTADLNSRNSAGNQKLGWLLQGGSHLLLIRSLDDSQTSRCINLRLSISPRSLVSQHQ
ncbi:hypothetical protein CW705_04740 [Candidatus Bathyarchaeota archaeon]|nr:MAG: hypothetical protein CW705_04740 [Candidatus Bathyarchaeota archaeon]